MNEEQFDALVNDFKNLKKTPLPHSFEQNVWREIRKKKIEPISFFEWLMNLREKPFLFSSGLVTACLIGLLIGSLTNSVPVKTTTREGLGLNVFSITSPDLPSTLLTENL